MVLRNVKLMLLLFLPFTLVLVNMLTLILVVDYPKKPYFAKVQKLSYCQMNGKKQVKTTLKSLEKNLKIPFLFTGLVNGAMGKVVGIIYAPGNNPPDLPHCVLVKFDSYPRTSLSDFFSDAVT